MFFSKIKCKKDVEKHRNNIETRGKGRNSSQRNKHTVVEMGNKNGLQTVPRKRAMDSVSSKATQMLVVLFHKTGR